MKTPEEIRRYRNEVIQVIEWAIEQGHIEDKQGEILKENVLGIELELYPKKMVKDENGWDQVESEYIYGLPFDEWE